jgi:hypothetical protein
LFLRLMKVLPSFHDLVFVSIATKMLWEIYVVGSFYFHGFFRAGQWLENLQ